jgi:hypothetical protein
MRLSKEMIEYIEGKAEELRALHGFTLSYSLVCATIVYMQECAKETCIWKSRDREIQSD